VQRALLTILIVLTAAALGCLFLLWTPDRSREELEAKYHVRPGDYLTVAGIRLRVKESGPTGGRVVILLHGFGSSLETWDVWAKVLSSDFRVIRFDLPGSGLTGPDPNGDYRDARCIQILVALMDRLGVRRASLIGNSIGGRIAWMFAALDPARVEKLVLISPDGFASPGFAYGKKPDVPSMVTLMRYALPKVVLRMNLVPAYGDSTALTDATVTRYYDLILAPGVRDAMIARMRETVLEDPEPLLRKIDAPTLLLWGEKDGMIPFSNSADYLRNIPHSTLVRLPGLGHVPQEEAPLVSLAPVRTFLER
jgi:pimeloyl-ACP methyl ester carboxylesterase